MGMIFTNFAGLFLDTMHVPMLHSLLSRFKLTAVGRDVRLAIPTIADPKDTAETPEQVKEPEANKALGSLPRPAYDTSLVSISNYGGGTIYLNIGSGPQLINNGGRFTTTLFMETFIPCLLGRVMLGCERVF
jgi:hypothetical protein